MTDELRDFDSLTTEEINVLVAERIFGFRDSFLCSRWKGDLPMRVAFKRAPNNMKARYAKATRFFDEHGGEIYHGHPHAVILPPDVVNDSGVAMYLLELMRPDHGWAAVRLEGRTSAVASIGHFDGVGDPILTAHAPSANLAIAKLALLRLSLVQ